MKIFLQLACLLLLAPTLWAQQGTPQCNNTPAGNGIYCVRGQSTGFITGTTGTVSFTGGYVSGQKIVVFAVALVPGGGGTGWTSGNISDTNNYTWTFWGNVSSGVLDGSVVQLGLWYTVVPTTTATTDTITLVNSHVTGGGLNLYSSVYSGLGAIDGAGSSLIGWSNIGIANSTTGNYTVTPGDLDIGLLFSSYPIVGPGENLRTTDTSRGILLDRIATGTVENLYAPLAPNQGGDGYIAIGIAFKPASASALSFTPVVIPPAAQSVAYDSYTIPGQTIAEINGGTPPYTLSKFSGTIPSGLSVAEVTPAYGPPTGLVVLSGTATTAGDYNWVEQVTDSLSNTATIPIYFVVVSSSLPTISSLAANVGSPAYTNTVTSPIFVPGGQNETITWTTNVATTTQVCYSTGGNDTTLCTPITDTGGVTSHTVTLTGLLAVTPYVYAPIVEGIVGGVGVDYLQTTDSLSITGGVAENFFTTETAPSSGSPDFNVYFVGPHNVVAGSPIVMAIYNSAVSDISGFTTLKFQLVWDTAGNVPSGTPAHTQFCWPDELNGGSGCWNNNSGFATVSTTSALNDTLTQGAPQTTQFEIMTNVGGTTAPGQYLLEIFVTWAGGGPTYSYTVGINVVAASFPTGSPSSQPAIPLLSSWQTNLLTPWPNSNNYWYQNKTYTGTACSSFLPNQSLLEGQGCAVFYDGTWGYQQIGLYTGNPTYWTIGANDSKATYHSLIQSESPPGNGINGYFVFGDGLYYDCTHNSVTASCSDLTAIATAANGATTFAPYLTYADPTLIREASEMFNAKRLDYDAGGTSTLALVQQMEAYVLGDIDQIVNGYGPQGVTWEQTFMDGIAADMLTKCYYDTNTCNGDARIPPALLALGEHLKVVDWLDASGTNGSALYAPFVFDFLTMNQQAPMVNTGDMTTLNSLWVPLYGYLWYNTGNTRYQLFGDTAFAAGVSDTGNCQGFSGKCNSQSLFWQFDYVNWRGGCTVNCTGSTTSAPAPWMIAEKTQEPWTQSYLRNYLRKN